MSAFERTASLKDTFFDNGYIVVYCHLGDTAAVAERFLLYRNHREVHSLVTDFTGYRKRAVARERFVAETKEFHGVGVGVCDYIFQGLPRGAFGTDGVAIENLVCFGMPAGG
jgi:hypothetical protein